MSEPKTKRIKLSELIPDPQNANKGTERGRYMLEHSISTLGAGRSVLVDKNNILIAGNKTAETAVESGFENAIVIETDGSELVVVRRTDLDLTTDSKAKQLAIADNRVSEINLNFDTEILLELDKEIDLSGFFSDDELKQFSLSLDDDGDGDHDHSHDDDIPEESNIPKRVKRGQLWEIAGHRLLCGDCSKPDDVAFLMGDTKVNVVVTSPPYASQRKYDEESGFKPIDPDEYVEWFEPIQANIKKHLAKDGSYFLNIKEHCEDGQRSLYVKDLTIAHARKWKWRFIDEFCWIRSGVPGGWNNRFKNSFEPVFQFCSQQEIKFRPESVSHQSDKSLSYSPDTPKAPSGLLQWNADVYKPGMARPSNVLDLPSGGGLVEASQTAAYPVALPEFFIKAFSDEGDRIYDPFLGSGTTMVAAHRNNRIGLGTEISEKYCDLILSRMQEITGDEPKLIGTVDKAMPTYVNYAPIKVGNINDTPPEGLGF